MKKLIDYLQIVNPYLIGTPNNTEYSEPSAFFRHYMNERGERTGAKFHADFGVMITSVSEYPEESWLAEHQ